MKGARLDVLRYFGEAGTKLWEIANCSIKLPRLGAYFPMDSQNKELDHYGG